MIFSANRIGLSQSIKIYYNKPMDFQGSISHDHNEESMEAKAHWFQSLSIEQRAENLCLFTDLILAVNPKILEKKDVKLIEGRIQVLSRGDLIASKVAAGGEVDLEDVRISSFGEDQDRSNQ
jgi:hypothetical protein